MKNLSKIVLVSGSFLALSACATVTRGTKETFFVLSEPAGAKAIMTNGQTCTTPCEMNLKRKDAFDVTVELDGYKSKTVRIESKMKGGGVAAGAGNIIAGGIIGGIVDGSNGAMKDLLPNPLKIVLASNSSSDESQVVDAERPKKSKKAKK